MLAHKFNIIHFVLFAGFSGRMDNLSSKVYQVRPDARLSASGRVFQCAAGRITQDYVRTRLYMRPDAHSSVWQKQNSKTTSGRDCSCVRTHIPVRFRIHLYCSYVRTQMPLRPDAMRSHDKKSDNLPSRLSMMIRFCASGLASGRMCLCVRTHDIL